MREPSASSPGPDPASAGRTIDLRTLPPNVLREIVLALGSRGSAILASHDRFVARDRVLLALIPVGLFGIAALAARTLGEPCFPQQELSWLGIYAIPALPLALAIVRAVQHALRAARMPFPPGVYVLERHVVVAHGPLVRIVPLATVAGIGAPRALPVGGQSEITLWMENEPAEACLVPRERAEAIAEALEKAREASLSAATGRRRIDALSELEVSSAWERASTARPRSDVAASIALAIPVALAIGTAILLARNAASDAIALDGAIARTDVEALRCYADGGGAHAEHVRRDALPRAAHAVAVAAGTASALGAYVEAYPDGPDTASARVRWIEMEHAQARTSAWGLRGFLARFPDAPQAAEARAALPRLSLEEAIRSDDCGAYAFVIREHPGTPEAAEARRRRHERYEHTLAAVLARGSQDEAAAFLRALFAYLEQNDAPEVLVRFRTPSNEALRVFDAIVAEQENVPVEPIAPSFARRLSMQRETLVFDRLATALRGLVPNDVMPIGRGAQLPDPLTDDELAARLEEIPEEERAASRIEAETARIAEAIEDDTGRPEIRIDYAIVPTGDVYVSDRPSLPALDALGALSFPGGGFPEGEPAEARRFAAFRIEYAIEMRVPGAVERHAFRIDVEPPASFRVDGGDGAPTERTIYEVMATAAFDRLGEGLVAAFLGTGAAPGEISPDPSAPRAPPSAP